MPQKMDRRAEKADVLTGHGRTSSLAPERGRSSAVRRGVPGGEGDGEGLPPWALVTQAVKPSGAVYWRRSPVQQSRQPLPPPPPHGT